MGDEKSWWSVVWGMRRVGGACEICMCLAQGGVGAERGGAIRELGLGFTILWKQGEC